VSPTYWEWFYYIARKWEMPPDVTAQELWVANVMATFGTDGKDIRPSASTVAKRAGLSDRQVKMYRTKAMEHGIFAWPGQRRHGTSNIPVLEIALPPDHDAASREAGFTTQVDLPADRREAGFTTQPDLTPSREADFTTVGKPTAREPSVTREIPSTSSDTGNHVDSSPESWRESKRCFVKDCPEDRTGYWYCDDHEAVYGKPASPVRESVPDADREAVDQADDGDLVTTVTEPVRLARMTREERREYRAARRSEQQQLEQ
jgi:hypothetical protein